MLLVSPDIDDWRRELDRISGGLPPRHFESRWKRHDGSLLSLTCSCSAIRGSAGDIQYTVCIVADSPFRELMKDRTAELRDISRFLHNTITQDLVCLSFNAGGLETTALELIDRCCRDIRVISCMLSPPSLFETALEESIELYAGYVREETALAIVVDIDPVGAAVSPEAQLLFFAAVQSLVVRGIRSRSRPELSVRLRNLGSAAVLELQMVSVAPESDSVSGWTIIRERARTLGGEFEIAGDSTRVSAKLSLPRSSEV
jgi:signal transduction histidine kinase